MPRFVPILIIMVIALIGWLAWRQTRVEPFVVSGFIEADIARIGSRVGGRIAEVLVDEGSQVKKGQPLIRIDPFDLSAQLANAKSNLAALESEHARLTAGFRPEEIEQARALRDEAAATLDRLVAGPRKEEINIARELLKIEQANYDYTRNEYERLSRLHEQAQAAPTELDNALRDFKSAEAKVAEAQHRLDLLLEGTRKEEIAAARATLAKTQQALQLTEAGYRKEEIARAEAEVSAAKARVAAIEVQLNELTISSPCDCVVEAMDLEPGDIIAANAPSIALLDPLQIWVRAYVPEARLGEVQLGTIVPIGVDTFPKARFKSRITFVAREAEFTPRNVQTPEERSKQVFRIKATLDEGHDRLRVGMAADVHFDEVPAK